MLANAVDDLRGPSKVRLLLEGDGGLLCEAVDLVPLNNPLRVALASGPIDRRDVLTYHKTTRREVYERAKASRRDADSVILWNTLGQVTEAAESNIVIADRGLKITPPVDSGLLPGTMRAELLERGEIVERVVTVEEVRAAEQIWLINSVRGWMPAVLLK